MKYMKFLQMPGMLNQRIQHKWDSEIVPVQHLTPVKKYFTFFQ